MTKSTKSLSAMLKTAANRRQVKADAPNVVVQARAGSGKTFTLVEGVKRVKGRKTPGIKGSVQQEAVWKEMVKGTAPRTICFVAFNKSIAEELGRKLPQGCQAMTLHSMGFSAVKKAYGKTRVCKWKTNNILEDYLGQDLREVSKDRPTFVEGVIKLVASYKQTLTDPTDTDALDNLAATYDIPLNGDREDIFEAVPEIMERSREWTHEVDFNDMVWLPVVNALPCFVNDLLLVDEAQDLNRSQQALALQCGRRLVLCGDARQAIYGFAGADTESINRMVSFLEETDNGCVQLALTETRRCGQAIVRLANEIVPDLTAHEDNPAGNISSMNLDQAQESMVNGDMVLCRVNAPLVSLCFRLIKAGVKANIKGRDIGDGLIALIKKSKAVSVDGLIDWVDDYFQKESQRLAKRKHVADTALIALEDKKACIMAFCEGATNLGDVRDSIKKMFSDDNGAGALLSAVHRAKGLEASRVFILLPSLIPHPMVKQAWEQDQEQNIKYVAVTRAINDLVMVD